MKIRLLLENKVVELTEEVAFPITKTYEMLNNPTKYISDFSKSIKIPATQINNEILGSIYRIDRVILSGGIENIGKYLDPSKRINFKLLYDNQVVMEGYAKYLNSTTNQSNTFYNLSLFGKLGEIFHKLKEVRTNYEQLSDDQKNQDDDGDSWLLDDKLSGQIMNRNWVYDSWMRERPSLDNLYSSSVDDFDIIGMAPSYRGKPNNFDASKMQIDETNIVDCSQILDEEWKKKYRVTSEGKIKGGETASAWETRLDTYVSGLKSSEVCNKGFKDYQLDEYRSVDLRPYIYINKLFDMYNKKCKELTGYSFEYDGYFFNINNPYWISMTYMFDFLGAKGTKQETNLQISAGMDNGYMPYDFGNFKASTYIYSQWPYKGSSTDKSLNIKSFPINNEIMSYYSNPDGEGLGIGVGNDTIYIYQIIIKNKAGETLGSKDFWSNPGSTPSIYKPNDRRYDENNWLPLKLTNTYDSNPQAHSDTVTVWTSTIPDFNITFTQNITDEITIEINSHIYLSNTAGQTTPFYYNSWTSGNPQWINIDEGNTTGIIINPINCAVNWRKNFVASLGKLYNKKEPLFDVLVNYTRMFGLLWVIDYNTKKVKIITKNTFFQENKILDWTDRLDTSKDFTLQQISFPSKYVEFNYDDVKGFKYSGYKEKYDIEYGAKRVSTNYNFDNSTTKLFDKIPTSCSSSRSFMEFGTLYNWNLTSPLKESIDPLIRMDADNENEESPINVNNFYMRGINYGLKEGYPVYISDDSDLMISNKPCWYHPKFNAYKKSILQIPRFDIIYREPRVLVDYNTYSQYWGGLFNTPQENYTNSNRIEKALDNFIYPQYWYDYIQERYNIQNRLLTAYIRITPIEFMNLHMNEFVTINNQLYMINKIYDYNINSNEPVKMDLIQVTNQEAYKTAALTFPRIGLNIPDILYLQGESLNTPTSYKFKCRSIVKPRMNIMPDPGTPAVDGAKIIIANKPHPEDKYIWDCELQFIARTKFRAALFISGHNPIKITFTPYDSLKLSNDSVIFSGGNEYDTYEELLGTIESDTPIEISPIEQTGGYGPGSIPDNIYVINNVKLDPATGKYKGEVYIGWVVMGGSSFEGYCVVSNNKTYKKIFISINIGGW